jgi:hypothetical protein
MDPFYTNSGPRPDLAAIEVNPPEGYIGSKLVPTVSVADKTGVVYYATVTSDGTAETDRAAGAAPDSTQISDSNTTFTCVEAILRGKITPDEAKTMGGIEKADAVGAKYAKRAVMKALETDIANLVLDSGVAASASFDSAKVLTQTQDALQALRMYEGKTTLVASSKTLKGMVQALLADSVQGKVVSRIIGGTTPAVATTGLNFEAWKIAMAMYFGVDQVLAGDDGIWNASGVSGRFAIGKFDDGMDELSHKWRPVYAKNFMFLPDGSNPYFIESIADRLTKNNMYDCSLWYDVVELNAAAKYVFDGV